MRRSIAGYFFPKMQKDDVLLFKQFDSDTKLPGRMTFHTAFVDPTVRPDAPERQSIECRAFFYFFDSEPNTCPVLPSDASANFASQYSVEGGCLSRRARHVGLLEGPRVVRADARRRVLRSACRTLVRDLECEVC